MSATSMGSSNTNLGSVSWVGPSIRRTVAGWNSVDFQTCDIDWPSSSENVTWLLLKCEKKRVLLPEPVSTECATLGPA